MSVAIGPGSLREGRRSAVKAPEVVMEFQELIIKHYQSPLNPFIEVFVRLGKKWAGLISLPLFPQKCDMIINRWQIRWAITLSVPWCQ